ncbi:hypothetical protein JTB14_027883 [Gonioctena quinquepunctata]|nr:hypothetical protein JTB14_027883 [Gonioctena quinquepunctata]
MPAYFRYEVGKEIFTSFVTSKFKVAPLNQRIVPELELQGIVLGCRLRKTICNEFRNRPREVELDVDTLEEASKLWLKKSQEGSFEEISLLNRNKTFPKSSRLSKLSAFLDETGIIRLGGRFPESEPLNLGYDFRYPVILDPKNKYTQC